MQAYPHTYRVSATAQQTGPVTVSAPDLPRLETGPPPQFDGPGGVWSPETLLCAAIGDCFILTFRSVSHAATFAWLKLECHVEGILERIDGVARYTRFAISATLTVPAGSDTAKSCALLERTERACLISNSLRGTRSLKIQVVTTPLSGAAA